MALYVIGGVVCDLHPLNVHEAVHETREDFARHPVMGAREGHEHMGPGDETLRLQGKVFPRKFGGLSELEQLDALRAAGDPVLVMRGDGANMRWWVIRRFERTHRYLDERGIGRLVTHRIDLERTEKPRGGAGGGALGLLTRLFGRG